MNFKNNKQRGKSVKKFAHYDKKQYLCSLNASAVWRLVAR